MLIRSQMGEYEWRRGENQNLSPGTCQHSESAGNRLGRRGQCVRVEPEEYGRPWEQVKEMSQEGGSDHYMLDM